MSAEEGEESKTYQYVILLLGLASIVMATAAVYLMEILSINYGAGLAIIGLANRTNSTAIQSSVTQIAAQIGNIQSAISETYLVAIISFGLIASALILYITRYRRFTPMSRRYTLLHGTLTLVYIALFYLALSNLQINYASPYFLSVFSAIGAALLIDIYLQFTISTKVPSAALPRRGMRIEPGAPYTSLLNLRDTIFSKLQGDVRVVDKHFNSDAISNLHRLLETNLSNISKLEIISSKEMFDAKFNDNYTDFRNELRNKGVELNLMLMSDVDSVEQHERFIFDDKTAYKIPPLNIINKKSEHIVGLRVGEARSRFETLMRNATKYDNYVVKQARGPS
ncbi:MAG: hypothetical protein KGH57_03250 [Candidatus Micrarchaeota archaeon]|nr:hypothetical protein [Candidatus Micrarchaeota archaeon]